MFHYTAHKCILAKFLPCFLVFVWSLMAVTTAAAQRGLHNGDPKQMPAEAMYPASEIPDNIVLSWGDGSPSNTQFINWRTNIDIKDGVVQYRELRAWDSDTKEKTAYYVELDLPGMVSEPVVKRFYVKLNNLKPNTAYQYRVGSKSADKWSPYHKFVTAPVFGAPFSFICLGDIQTSYDLFEKMLERIDRRHSSVNFYLLTGDLVDNGENRNQWDALLRASGNFFARKPVAAAMGNDDSHYINDKNKTLLFSEYFHLPPQNGPPELPQHRAYSFAYSNAYFIILSTNDDTKRQNAWLEQNLAYAREHSYQWIVVMFHHPVYPVHTKRSYTDLQEQWVPLFDKYDVDLVLTGHDHAYMRTPKLKNHQTVADGEKGTIYVITNSSEKHFPAKYLPQTLVAIKDTPVYLKVDCRENSSGIAQMRFRAYTLDGDVVDEFMLEK